VGTPTSYGSLSPSSNRGLDESSSIADDVETSWKPSVTEKATLEVSFDPHITGLRSIMESMVALNPEFIIKLIPNKVLNGWLTFGTRIDALFDIVWLMMKDSI
jgi:hypothetical protein